MPCLKAVIIAGGKGTRIRSLTGDLIPKAFVPVAGEPIILRQLKLLVRYGIYNIAVLAGHLADSLKEKLLPEAGKLGIKLEFFVESEPLGTAGGLWAAKNFLGEDDFFVLYGDVAVEMDLIRLLDFHRSKGAIATIVSHPNDHPHDSDLLRIDENGRILNILPRKERKEGYYPNLVPAAVYCLSKEIFNYTEASKKQDFISDIFPRIINKSSAVYSYNTPEYLRDVGTVDRYQMVEEDIRSGFFEQMNFSVKRPAVFFDRDGVLNYEVGGRGLVHHNELELIPNAAKAVQLVNNSGWLAVVATNQPQIAKGFTSFNELDIIHAKLETLLGYEGAKLDRIYFCPHHPEKGFEGEIAELKIDCDCRKPKTGMLLRANRELPVLPDDSCVIGDSWRDAGAARNAGIYSYGVRTGVACRDCKGIYWPDLIFSDVLEAVKFAIFGMPQANAIADKIVGQAAKKNAVLMVGICGISRSGKSTLAHAILKRIKKQNISTAHIKLDDWILPPSMREPVSAAEDRTQTHLYNELLNNIIEGKEITTQGYNPTKKEISEKAAYRLDKEQVILLDGILACHKTIRDKLDYALYVEADDRLLISRFYEFYRWKGMNNDQIEKLLAERKNEEWKVVTKQRDFADEKVQIIEERI